MKKLNLIILTILISFFAECEKEKSQCFYCERITDNQFEWILETINLCGTQEELENKIRDGDWKCSGFQFTSGSNNNNNNPTIPIPGGTPGTRVVQLIRPDAGAVNVNLDVTLTWNGLIQWYKNPNDAGWLTLSSIVICDVYLGTEVIPTKIDSSFETLAHSNITYVTKLEASTRYYWKIIVKNSNLIATSNIRSFETKP